MRLLDWGNYYRFVLDTLNTIDWSKVAHAYGPAKDLPGTLQALASGDEKQRKQALWELHGSIWHQGTVYEATAFAVPFLLELVEKNHADSLEVLALLALIANGSSYLAVHGNTLKVNESEYQARLAQELLWVARAKEAVAMGSPLFMNLLAAEDARLREMCAFLLGLSMPALPPSAEISAVELIERILRIES